MALTSLVTPETVSRGDLVNVITDNVFVPYEVVWITQKTLSLKRKTDKLKKRAYWSERKGCYSVDNKYKIVWEDD